jgi:hypothetical protein
LGRIVGKVAGFVVMLTVAVVLYFVLRGDIEDINTESKYDGVHLCSQSQQDAAALDAQPEPSPTLGGTPGPSGAPGASRNDTLLPVVFAQNDPAWGSQEYDHGGKENVGCGKTIAECGCAMTSVATVLSLFQLLTTPEGSELNPASLNGWFNKGAKQTSAGWVSQGYVYGSVVWSAVNNFTATPRTGIGGASPQRLRFNGWGNGSEAEIRNELTAGRPVVLEVPGHYIAAIGLQGEDILINDPYYKERTTLASYSGRVKSSRLFTPSQDLRAITITVPGGSRVQVTDASGRVVGTLAKGDPATVQESAKRDLPRSSYQFEDQWRDPTCTERPPREGAGVNSIHIPMPESGTYRVRAINHEGNATSVMVYAYDVNGELKMETHEGRKEVSFDINYGSGAPPVTTTPTPPTPTPPTVTPVPVPATPTSVPATSTSVPPTNTPVRPTLTPTPTVGPPVRITVSVEPISLFCNSINPAVVTIRLLDSAGRPAVMTGALPVRLSLNPPLAASQTVSLTENTRVIRVAPAGPSGTVQVNVSDARDPVPAQPLQPGTDTFRCSLTP